jgi:hypothetical protein
MAKKDKKKHDWDEVRANESYMEDRIHTLIRENANLRGILFDVFHEGHGLTIPTGIILRMVRALNNTEVK